MRGVTSAAPHFHSWFRTGLSTGISLAKVRFRRFRTGLQKRKPPDERSVQRILDTFRLRRKRNPFPRFFRTNMRASGGRRKVPDMDSENSPGRAAPSEFSERHYFANGRRNCHSGGFPTKYCPDRNRSGKVGLRNVRIPTGPLVNLRMDPPHGFERRVDCNLVTRSDRCVRKSDLGGSRNSGWCCAARKTGTLNRRRPIGCTCSQCRNQQGGAHCGLHSRGF